MKKQIPSPGLGTWQNTEPEKCKKSVKQALKTGYRHIDTAQIYNNEEYVGQAIEESEVNREEIFLATKVWSSNLSKKNVIKSTKKSLDRLKVDKVDILYIHWPSGDYQPRETLKAFQRLVKEGKTDYIGISNFTPDLADEALKYAEGKILANQVEMHPLLPQKELQEYCRDNDLYLVAYSPIARGEVFRIPEISEVAEKHGISEVQASLAWLMQKENVIPIPKSSKPEHIKENWKARKIKLDEDDIEKIDSIEERKRLINPRRSPW